jgi:hypothetical protein
LNIVIVNRVFSIVKWKPLRRDSLLFLNKVVISNQVLGFLTIYIAYIFLIHDYSFYVASEDAILLSKTDADVRH